MSDNDTTGTSDDSSSEPSTSSSLSGYVRQLAENTSSVTSSMFGAPLYEAVLSVANLVDETLEELVKPSIYAVGEARRERAMDNPIYRDIEERRKEGGQGKLLLSEEHGLGVTEWEIQDEILDEVRDDPWWYDAAQKLRQSPTSNAVSTVWGWYQRAARGWSDYDAGNLDLNMSRTLGEQLNYLADIAHGWPANEEYPEFEDWTNALRENAALLLAYVNGKTRELTDEDDLLTFKERLQREDDLAAGAKQAYAWVSRNFQALWD